MHHTYIREQPVGSDPKGWLELGLINHCRTNKEKGSWASVQETQVMGRQTRLPNLPSGKESASLTGDTGSICESGRSPGVENGNPFQVRTWEILWRGEPVGCSPWGHKIVRYTWVTKQQQQKVTRKHVVHEDCLIAFIMVPSPLIKVESSFYWYRRGNMSISGNFLYKRKLCALFSLHLKIIHMPKRHILGWQILISFSTFQLQNLVRIESSHFQHQVEGWEVEAKVLIALLCWLEWVFFLYISWLYSMKRIFPHEATHFKIQNPLIYK